MLSVGVRGPSRRVQESVSPQHALHPKLCNAQALFPLKNGASRRSWCDATCNGGFFLGTDTALNRAPDQHDRARIFSIEPGSAGSISGAWAWLPTLTTSKPIAGPNGYQYRRISCSRPVRAGLMRFLMISSEVSVADVFSVWGYVAGPRDVTAVGARRRHGWQPESQCPAPAASGRAVLAEARSGGLHHSGP